jgi:hypothetical protein
LNRAAAAKAEEDGLPRLEGSERQVAAATTVREKFRLQSEMAFATVLSAGLPASGVQHVRSYFENQLRVIRDAATYMNWRHRTWVVLIHDCLSEASKDGCAADVHGLLMAFVSLSGVQVGSHMSIQEDGRLRLDEVAMENRQSSHPNSRDDDLA